MQPDAKTSKINPEIEYLRAAAVLIVIYIHAHVVCPGPSLVYKFLLANATGWTGVDLFFCISGYVISKSLVDTFDKNSDQWFRMARAFWVRRIFRIVPSAWLWVLLPLLCSIYFNSSGSFLETATHIKSFLAVILNVGNIVGPKTLGPEAVYWSLSLEEQFYLLYPFFLILTPQKLRIPVFLTLICLQFFPDRSHLDDSLWWLTRTDAIMWGCVIFQFAKSSTYKDVDPTLLRNKHLARTVSWAALATFTILPVHAHHLNVTWIVGLVSAIMVWLASYQNNYVMPAPPWISKILMWIGSRSFALYLIHIPAAYFSKEIFFRISQAFDIPYGSNLNTPCVLTWISIVVVVAEMNYRFVEVPLRRMGSSISARIAAGRRIPAATTAVGL